MTTVTRQALSRDVIASAALHLLDTVGLNGLSMRKLGAELGVEAMSLYHYISSKDDLLDAVVELLYAEVDIPKDLAPPTSLEEWEEPVRRALTSFYEVMCRHPASVELFAHRSIKGPNGFLVLYWAYEHCAKLGLSPAQAPQMFQLVVGYVIGRAASDAGLMSRDPESAEAALAATQDDPGVNAFVRHNQALDHDELFQMGLDCLLQGLYQRFNAADIFDS